MRSMASTSSQAPASSPLCVPPLRRLASAWTATACTAVCKHLPAQTLTLSLVGRARCQQRRRLPATRSAALSLTLTSLQTPASSSLCARPMHRLTLASRGLQVYNMRAWAWCLLRGVSHHCLHCSHTCQCIAVLSWSVTTYNGMLCVVRAHLQPKRWLSAERSLTPVLSASVQTPRHSPRCVFTTRMTSDRVKPQKSALM